MEIIPVAPGLWDQEGLFSTGGSALRFGAGGGGTTTAGPAAPVSLPGGFGFLLAKSGKTGAFAGWGRWEV